MTSDDESGTSTVQPSTSPRREYVRVRLKRKGQPTARRGKPFTPAYDDFTHYELRLKQSPTSATVKKGSFEFGPEFLEAMTIPPLSNENNIHINQYGINQYRASKSEVTAAINKSHKEYHSYQKQASEYSSSQYNSFLNELNQANASRDHFMSSIIQNDPFGRPHNSNTSFDGDAASSQQQQQQQQQQYSVNPSITKQQNQQNTSRIFYNQANPSLFCKPFHDYASAICYTEPVKRRFKKTKASRIVPYPMKRRRKNKVHCA